MVITEIDMMSNIQPHSMTCYNTSTDLCIDLWCSLTSKPKREMLVQRAMIADYGHMFLRYLMQMYQDTGAQNFRTTQSKLSKIDEKIFWIQATGHIYREQLN